MKEVLTFPEKNNWYTRQWKWCITRGHKHAAVGSKWEQVLLFFKTKIEGKFAARSSWVLSLHLIILHHNLSTRHELTKIHLRFKDSLDIHFIVPHDMT